MASHGQLNIGKIFDTIGHDIVPRNVAAYIELITIFFGGLLYI